MPPPERRPRLIHGAPPPSLGTRALKFLALGISCLLVIGPFLTVISTSLADQAQINAAGGYVLWPTNPSLKAYQAVLGNGVVTRSVIVSIGITVVGSGLSLVASSLLAYGLSRPGSLGHRPLLLMVLFTMLFSAGIIPNYLLIKQLGLLDSWWSLILPTAMSGFQIILLRQFFMEVPQDIVDAARIDGAGDMRILVTIIAPLSKAGLAVVTLFNAVSYWNAYFNAVIYLNSSDKWPLQLVLRSYVVDGARFQTNMSTDYVPPLQSIQMAILVVSLIPIMVVYPLLQRHFAKGMMIGAVKG